MPKTRAYMPPARLYERKILVEGDSFRCEKCLSIWPISHHYKQDGLDVCLRCVREVGGEDVERLDAEARDAWPELDPPRFVIPQEGITCVTSVSPASASLAPGGNVEVTLSGHGLSTADSIIVDTANFSVGTPAYNADGTQCVVTITALGGAAPGDYDLGYNLNKRIDYFRIRS